MSDRWASQCGSKRRHSSERKATEEAKRQQIDKGCAMNAYECPFCKGWHVGTRWAAERKERHEEWSLAGAE